ncbi:MAG: LEPR-XLL domain-containing protein, partial [Planctomycetaceae bacterium]|nr:LEPR-XLL domain-containing protein [Planctomycetaceae bacterium]
MSASHRRHKGRKHDRQLNSRTIRFEQLEDRQLLAADLGMAAHVSILPTTPVASYSIDGTGNNVANPTWGSTGVDFLRTVPAQYGDGISTPAGASRPSARAISNAVADQGSQDEISARLLSAMSYAWGQFIDHDLDLTNSGTGETLKIAVPTGDPYFDPNSTGTKTIDTVRSAFDPATGSTTPREQMNAITAFVDGSMVYGSDATTANALRTMTDGQLKTSAGNMLPWNDAATFPDGTVNMAGIMPGQKLYAAGDVRANENVELTALQTLFVREHNQWATKIKAANPTWTDEQIYQQARSIVIGEIQAITYKEWLPAILGKDALSRYQGYNATVNPGIANEFSTAAFRFGHSLLGDDVEFFDNNGEETRDGVTLSQAFFNPELISQTGIDPLLKYLSSDPASELDTQVVNSVRNFLFGPPGSGGLDLASLNIERGRDHGLADYNSTRAAYNLPKVTSFAQITSNVELQGKLQQLYGSVDNVDLWVGALAEDHVAGASVGPTLKAIIADQFTRLRDGDRLFYLNNFTGSMLQQIDHTTLADIVKRNTTVTNLQGNLFFFDSSVGGTVFGDGNEDGKLNPVEKPVANRTVNLVDAETGEIVATTKSDARGHYDFDVSDGLRTGDYKVNVMSSDGKKVEFTSKVLDISRGEQHLHNVDLAVAAATTTPPKPAPKPQAPVAKKPQPAAVVQKPTA